jgi:salicylate hydroxylase
MELSMSAASEKSPVLVVGGGIGGLSTALALSRKGIPVQVLEQAAEFKEIGAGIQLGPNVFRMFEVLGPNRRGLPLGVVSRVFRTFGSG